MTSIRWGDGEQLGNNRYPPEGFNYPEVGTTVVCLRDYPTGSRENVPIPKGARGTVTELRLPGSYPAKTRGYVGCGMYFEEIRPVYSCGIIIPWDKAGNPELFRFE